MIPKLNIGLLWHTLGHPNLGVDALTRANIAIIGAACDRAGVEPEFMLLGTPGSSDGGSWRLRQGSHPALKQIILGSGPFIRDVEKCDIVFDTSEGDSFTDIYGVKRALVQAGSKLVALRDGRNLVLSPQTIGPFNSGWSKILAKHVIRKCRMTFARDHLSTQALGELGVQSNIDEVIDVAFRLPYQKPAARDTDRLSVGVNVSGLMFLAAERFQMTIDYPRFIRALLANLTTQRGVDVWLIPHVLAEGSEDDDGAVNRLIQSEFPSAKLAPSFKDSIEAKSFISGLDFFTGARMHACIAAFSSGVPVVPIAYSRKFNGLFQSLKYERFVDGRTTSTEAAIDTVMNTMSARSAAKVEIDAGLAIAYTKLGRYEEAVARLLGEVASAKAA